MFTYRKVGSCMMETEERCVIWDVNENIKQWRERGKRKLKKRRRRGVWRTIKRREH